jgi:Protein of unknown function (DUF2855)
MATEALAFEVSRKDLRATRVQAGTLDCPAGGVLCRIERFALTANNITYGVFGDAMAYWNFFPAEAGWGRIPVWGFAEVIESKHEAVRKGERVYGYLPMATHVVLQPDKVTDAQFMDGVAHRRPLPTPYQVYARLAKDPLHDPQHEDERALLHPLFFTSWLAEDFLADNGLFGGEQLVLASASSKTALGIAFMAKQHGTRTVGLTSPGNRAFCEQVGYYDEVFTYDQVAAMGRSHEGRSHMPTVYVDMAGDGKLLHAVHHHFAEALKYSCIIGATHWENRQTQHQLPGAKPQFFFAPTQVGKRTKDWGYDGLVARLGAGWRAFLPSVKGWLEVRHGRGPAAVEAVYREVLEGRQPPKLGHLLSMHAG